MPGHEELRNSLDWQNQLYSRYHQKVFGICLYFLKDREEAKDACHDVFIKAFRAWKDFEWKCDPLTWIGAIAKHDCFSRRQRFKKQMDRRAQLAMEEETWQNCEPEEDLVLHRMRLEKLMPKVRGKLKEILHLSLEQGLNHREIAVRMGVTRVAITRRLTRFKKELQGVGQARELAFARANSRTKTRTNTRVNSRPTSRPTLRPEARLKANVFQTAMSDSKLESQTGVEEGIQLIAA